MAVLALLEDIANGRIQRELVLRDYYDFLSYGDDHNDMVMMLISRIRFPRAILLELCTKLGPGRERETARSHTLPVQYDPDYTWFSGNRIITERMTAQ